jgi:hypothetical protein
VNEPSSTESVPSEIPSTRSKACAPMRRRIHVM